MKIKLWGVRGSLPAPHPPKVLDQRVEDAIKGFFEADFHFKEDIPQYLRLLPPERSGGFGGNTPCAEVTTDSSRIILDGGSGMRRLGLELMSGPCGKGKGEIHLIMTHFHWDHLIGIPFFIPIFVPGNKIHVYSVQQDTEEVFRTLFKKPFFPVPYENLGAKIEYHRLSPREPRGFGDVTVTPYELDHPDPCWGYKFEHKGRKLAYCVDTEAVRASREKLGPDLPLYEGLEVMVFDAQYSLKEAVEKVNWGHAAATIGLDIAMREGIKRVAFVHHDPAASDDKIVDAEAKTREYYEAQLRQAEKMGKPLQRVEWWFAREDTVIEV